MSTNAEPKILTLDELIGADDRPSKVLEVPEWGGAVEIRALSLGAFQTAQENATVDGELDEQKMAVQIVCAGVVNPPLTVDHAPLLLEKSIKALIKVMVEIATLSEITDDDLTAAERQFHSGAE